jgi:hypothetical protein
MDFPSHVSQNVAASTHSLTALLERFPERAAVHETASFAIGARPTAYRALVAGTTSYGPATVAISGLTL